MILSSQTKRNIRNALDDIKKNRTYSTKEVKKKLGIEAGYIENINFS